MGALTSERLEDALALHIRDIVARVFAWTEGTYEFEAEPEAATPELTLKLSTGELILEAVRQVSDPDVVRYALGDLDRLLGLSSDPLLRFQKVALSPTDGFVLSRVDGTLSAREVMQMIPLPVGGDAEEPLRPALHGHHRVRARRAEEGRGPRRPSRPGPSAPRPPDAPAGEGRARPRPRPRAAPRRRRDRRPPSAAGFGSPRLPRPFPPRARPWTAVARRSPTPSTA